MNSAYNMTKMQASSTEMHKIIFLIPRGCDHVHRILPKFSLHKTIHKVEEPDSNRKIICCEAYFSILTCWVLKFYDFFHVFFAPLCRTLLEFVHEKVLLAPPQQNGQPACSKK